MKRTALLLGGLLALGIAAPAAANSVTREYAPLPPLIEDDSCGYLIDVTFPVNNEYAISFYDNNGDWIRTEVTGRLVVTFTNPANGKAVTANISGPSSDNGAVFVTSGPTGGPVFSFDGLVLFEGRTSTDGSVHGTLILDVCAALA